MSQELTGTLSNELPGRDDAARAPAGDQTDAGTRSGRAGTGTTGRPMGNATVPTLMALGEPEAGSCADGVCFLPPA